MIQYELLASSGRAIEQKAVPSLQFPKTGFREGFDLSKAAPPSPTYEHREAAADWSPDTREQWGYAAGLAAGEERERARVVAWVKEQRRIADELSDSTAVAVFDGLLRVTQEEGDD